MIVEVPPEAEVQQTKQYKMLAEDESWVSVKIDGCTPGQRLVMPFREGDQNLAYCKVGLAANIQIRPKLSDKCCSNHTHANQECMYEHAEKGRRTSQVSRRLLNALNFRAPNEGRLVSMPVSIPKGRVDRVIVTWDGARDVFVEPKGAKGCVRIRCREPLGTCAREDELIQKISKACRNDLHTPVLFVASLLRSGEGPGEVEGSRVGGKSCPGGKYKQCVEISQAPTEEVCGSVYFSLDMPTSCSCWSWPELNYMLSFRAAG